MCLVLWVWWWLSNQAVLFTWPQLWIPLVLSCFPNVVLQTSSQLCEPLNNLLENSSALSLLESIPRWILSVTIRWMSEYCVKPFYFGFIYMSLFLKKRELTLKRWRTYLAFCLHQPRSPARYWSKAPSATFSWPLIWCLGGQENTERHVGWKNEWTQQMLSTQGSDVVKLCYQPFNRLLVKWNRNSYIVCHFWSSILWL